MRKITEEHLLPKFVKDALEEERSRFPLLYEDKKLGDPGFEVYHVWEMYWGWDKESESVISDGRIDPKTGKSKWIDLNNIEDRSGVYDKKSLRKIKLAVSPSDDFFDELLIEASSIQGSGVEVVSNKK